MSPMSLLVLPMEALHDAASEPPSSCGEAAERRWTAVSLAVLAAAGLVGLLSPW